MWILEPQTGQPLVIGILTYGPDSYDADYSYDEFTGASFAHIHAKGVPELLCLTSSSIVSVHVSACRSLLG